MPAPQRFLPHQRHLASPGSRLVNSVSLPLAVLNTISASDNRVGWTAGFGAEFALTNNWSAKAETNYLGFGTRGLTLSDGTFVNSKLNFWESKIGLNYRFSSM